MKNSIAPRRSRRIAAQKSTSNATYNRSPIRKSSFPSSSRTSSVDLELIELKLAHKSKKLWSQQRNTRVPARTQIIDDSASSSGLSTDESEGDEDDENEFSELADLSNNNLEWGAADDIDARRNLSYDSRCEPGNEDYDHDSFVVSDDEEDFIGGADKESQKEEPSDGRRLSHHISRTCRSSSRESRLFVSDPEVNSDILAVPTWSDSRSSFQSIQQDIPPLITEVNPEVVEEILDAFTLFSRRCNRYRAPVSLRLAAIVYEDKEVREALDSAVRLGLGRKMSLADGSKRWTIGPRI